VPGNCRVTVRVRAKIAAQHQGVTIGEWVSQTLIAVADEERANQPENLIPVGLAQHAVSAGGFGAGEHALRPLEKDKAAQKQPAPWSIRGVSQESRDKSVNAAARRNMTIGAWVDQAIITRADRQAGIEPPREPSQEMEKTMGLIEAIYPGLFTT
jgi:hypothetical protein